MLNILARRAGTLVEGKCGWGSLHPAMGVPRKKLGKYMLKIVRLHGKALYFSLPIKETINFVLKAINFVVKCLNTWDHETL